MEAFTFIYVCVDDSSQTVLEHHMYVHACTCMYMYLINRLIFLSQSSRSLSSPAGVLMMRSTVALWDRIIIIIILL